MRKSVLWAGGGVALVAVVVAGVAFYPKTNSAPQAAEADFAVSLTPPGVTLTALDNPRKPDGLAHVGGIMRGAGSALALSDADGLTYYTYDKDTDANKSSCSGDCLTKWHIAAAPRDAKAEGDWSVVARDDGSTQWAFRGKPLYSFADDTTPGEAKGSAATGASDWHPALLKISGKDAYTATSAQPSTNIGPFPFGISLQQVDEAGGQVLVNELGRTIYMSVGGKPEADKAMCAGGPCDTAAWVPVGAAALANGIGSFTVVSRADGTRQWAYRNRPLYTYRGDAAPNQTKGIGVDSRWKPAVIVRDPTPAPVIVQTAPSIGKVLATMSGQSLYRQQIYYYTVAGHDFEHGVPYQQILGRALGTKGCEGNCTKQWHPFVAAPDAQPSGYWSIVARADGSRQWAYKGYALYTFDGDKKPGDLLGLNSWNLSINDPALHAVSFLTTLKIEAETMSGIQWTTAYP